MKCRHIIGAALAALFLSACGSDQAFLKAQADSITAQSNARVAEAQAAAEEARAVTALAAKIDAGGASAYLVAKALKGMAGGSTTTTQVVQRPRDFLDYLQAATGVVQAVGSIAVPIVTVKEQSKVARVQSDNSVLLEGQRQAGESSRFASATGSLERLGVAGVTADRGAHTTTTITAGGDVANQGSSIARISCEATGGNWTPSVPPTVGAVTAPPALSGAAGSGSCTQR